MDVFAVGFLEDHCSWLKISEHNHFGLCIENKSVVCICLLLAACLRTSISVVVGYLSQASAVCGVGTECTIIVKQARQDRGVRALDEEWNELRLLLLLAS